jgi:hypothetical protein
MFTAGADLFFVEAGKAFAVSGLVFTEVEQNRMYNKRTIQPIIGNTSKNF